MELPSGLSCVKGCHAEAWAASCPQHPPGMMPRPSAVSFSMSWSIFFVFNVPEHATAERVFDFNVPEHADGERQAPRSG